MMWTVLHAIFAINGIISNVLSLPKLNLTFITKTNHLAGSVTNVAEKNAKNVTY